MRHGSIGACLLLWRAGGCDAECDPATATTTVSAIVSTPAGDPVDDAIVEFNGAPCRCCDR